MARPCKEFFFKDFRRLFKYKSIKKNTRMKTDNLLKRLEKKQNQLTSERRELYVLLVASRTKEEEIEKIKERIKIINQQLNEIYIVRHS